MKYIVVRFSSEPFAPRSRETISVVYGIFPDKNEAFNFAHEVIDKTDDEWFIYELTTWSVD